MTRGTPEPEPNAAAGDRSRNDRRAAPDWNVDQDWYAGPAYEDTGWHLDLSDVNWGRRQGPHDSASRFGDEGPGDQRYHDGNAPGQPSRRAGGPGETPPGWEERAPGRRGRHSRPHPDASGAPPGRAPGQRRGQPDKPGPELGYEPRPYDPPVYEDPAEVLQNGPTEPRAYRPGDFQPDNYRADPGYEDRTRTRRSRGRAPQTGDYQTGDYQADSYRAGSGYADRTPTRRNRSPQPPAHEPHDYEPGDHEPRGYDQSDYAAAAYDDPRAEPARPGGYQPPAYGDAGATSQTRPHVPERYDEPGGRADPYPGGSGYEADALSNGDTQHVRARPPEADRPRTYQPPGEPDYDTPDDYGTGDYETGDFDADYQTDIFELTGYGQAVPGLPPPGLPPPPRTRPPGPQTAALRHAGTGTRTASAGIAADNVDVVRSSGVMAAGTLGSRLTGFVRTLVLSFAIGVIGIGQAYNLSNTLPNVVYNLALGGILTSVVVPLIVAAAKRDSDRGRGYDQRMFTLGTIALAAITLVATALAVPIAHLYSGSKVTGNVEHLTIIFAFFFIPQIFFYGVSSLMGAILNAHGSFSAPMWTPIVNNVVVIAVFGLYIAVAGVHKSPATISGTDVALLGFGTTLGIVAQTVALVPAMRRVGFRWHPRLDFRRSEVAEIGRMGGWMFCYIAATQVAYLITTRVAGDTRSGVSDYSYAWLLFQLPYAVVGISVITALLPRMSAHAHDRRLGMVRADFSTGVRLAATIVVPCSLILAALGPSLGQVFFGHGASHPGEGRYVGVVFAVFCLGLLPYMIFQLQLRVFYSLHDSKTPAMIGLVTMVVNIVANLVALAMLSNRDLVAGLGVGFGLANLAGMILASRILSVRLRGLDGYRIGRSLVRMHAATLPAALMAVLVALVSSNAYVDVIIGGGLAMVIYLVFGRALRIEELTGLTRSVRARLGR
jgi:putative peptidoglycan lipid II flippase